MTTYLLVVDSLMVEPNPFNTQPLYTEIDEYTFNRLAKYGIPFTTDNNCYHLGDRVKIMKVMV